MANKTKHIFLVFLLSLFVSIISIFFYSWYIPCDKNPCPKSDNLTNYVSPDKGVSVHEAALSIPTRPSNVTAKRTDQKTVNINWHPGGTSQIMYHVYKNCGVASCDYDFPMLLVGATKDTFLVDKDAENKSCCYAITSFNDWGTESKKTRKILEQ